MTEIPRGISLTETDDGFTINRKDADGNVTFIPITHAEMFGLHKTISLWSDRMKQASQARSGELHPVIAHPVQQIGLITDALKANVLAIMEAPSGERMIFSLPLPVASYLLETLPAVIQELLVAASEQKQ